MSAGYVYVLSNPSMPGLIKIGRSIKGGASRSREFYKTGVPAPFALEFEMYCPEHEYVEREAHRALKRCRENESREFFRTTPDEGASAIMRAFLEGVSGVNEKIVADDVYGAAVDLLAVSHQHNLPALDVFDCILYLEKEHVQKAIGRMLEERAKPRPDSYLFLQKLRVVK